MSYEIILFIAILVLAFTLFAREVFPLEVSALLILVLLVFSGILTKDQAFSSFGNESLVLIGSLFVMIAGLTKTGIIKKLEEYLIKLSRGSRTLSFTIILLLVAVVSAFVSNTATLAVTIPIVISLARQFNDSPKKWLMPVAFASVLGGMNSLIGTSTNIIISSLLPEYGMDSFSLFTTANVGIWILIIGIIYLVFISRHLIPEGDIAENVGLKYDLREYTTEVTVLEDSPLVNNTLASSPLFKEVEITVLGVIRKGVPFQIPRGSFILRTGDRLIVEGNIKKLTEIRQTYGLKFVEETKSAPQTEQQENGEKPKQKKEEEVQFHEVIVTARSLLNFRTPPEVQLRNRYRISLIAVNRQGVTVREKLSNIRMSAGDILVVQFLGPIDNTVLDHLGLVPLKAVGEERYRTERAPIAALLFVGALLVGSITDIPLSVCCLAGALLTVVFNILRPQELYDSIEWKVLLFIGAVLCLGKGMDASGTALYLAEFLSDFFTTIDPTYAVSFFFILTVIMTQLLSNQATAVVMVPLAISTSSALGLNPMPFVMAVTIAASCCFVTPFEPAFMLVYGPGEYRFADFFKVGIALNILAIIIGILVIPTVWPL